MLIVTPGLPAFDRSGGARRLHAMVRILARRYRLRVVALEANEPAADPARSDEYVQRLTALGVEVCEGSFRLRDLERWQPWAVLFVFYRTAASYLDAVRFFCPAAHVLVDSVDLHYVREWRMSVCDPSRKSAGEALSTKRRELGAYRRSDGVIVVTEEDKRILERDLPGVPIYVIPNIHEVDPVAEPGARQNDSLLFVGGFTHAPNVDAVIFFCREILPLVRAARPATRVTIVGDAPPDEVRRLATLPGVRVTGYVPDLKSHIREAAVSIAPLRYGSGMKWKIAEAMACGLPVVTTTIGAEGMGLRHGETVLIADSAETFARAVVSLGRDAVLRERLGRNARDYVARTFSVAAGESKLFQLLDSLALRQPKKLGALDRLKLVNRVVWTKTRRMVASAVQPARCGGFAGAGRHGTTG